MTSRPPPWNPSGPEQQQSFYPPSGLPAQCPANPSPLLGILAIICGVVALAPFGVAAFNAAQVDLVQYADYASHAAAVAETTVGFIPTRDKSAIKSDTIGKSSNHETRDIEMMVNASTTMWITVRDRRNVRTTSSRRTRVMPRRPRRSWTASRS